MVDPEEVLRAHPDLAATQRDQFAAMKLLEQALAVAERASRPTDEKRDG